MNRVGKLCSPVQDFGAPVLATCGFSGSGKTTLLEAAIPHLIARGLSVAAIKHDSHGFVVDRAGKDSERLFRAGATVALRGPSEQFFRRGTASMLTLEATLADLARDHDLLLVEGHKDTPLPKLWLCGDDNLHPPDEVTGVEAILPWDSDRLGIFLSLIEWWLPKTWLSRSLLAGLLVGGKTEQTRGPKQPVRFSGRAFEETVACAFGDAFDSGKHNHSAADNRFLNSDIVVLGAGLVPGTLNDLTRLPDPPGLVGPIAGLLAMHRWAPRTTCVLAACDDPWFDQSDICSLVEQRRPGAWAILPRQSDGHPCPTLALYEPQALAVLERALLARGANYICLAALVDHPHTRDWVMLQSRNGQCEYTQRANFRTSANRKLVRGTSTKLLSGLSPITSAVSIIRKYRL